MEEASYVMVAGKVTGAHQTKSQTMCRSQLGLVILLGFTLTIGRRLKTQLNLGVGGSPIAPKG